MVFFLCRNKFKTNFFFLSELHQLVLHQENPQGLLVTSRLKNKDNRKIQPHTSTLKMQIGLGGHSLVVHILNQLINHWETTIYLNIHYKVQTEEDSALDPQVTKSLQYLCMYFSSALACLLIGMYLGKNKNNYQSLVIYKL